MDDLDLVQELGLWKWLVAFLVITLVPAAIQMIKEGLRSKREKQMYECMLEVSKMPPLLADIKELLQAQYTEDISASMCDALLHSIMENASRSLNYTGVDIIRNNNLQEQRPDIEQRIKVTINNIWAQNNDWLSRFRYKGTRLDELLNSGWHEQIEVTVITSIYDCKGGKDRKIKFLTNNVKTEFENIVFNTMALIQKM